MTSEPEIGVLGTTTVHVGGARLDLGAPRLRALLALLVLAEGRGVPSARLVEHLWGATPSRGAANTLQGYVASLRRLLEPARTSRAAPTVLLHDAGAYRLAVPGDRVDCVRFAVAVQEAEAFTRSAGDAARPVPCGSPADAAAQLDVVDRLTSALDSWRGEPFADLDGDLDAVAAERTRLDELRVRGRALVAVGDLRLDRADRAVASLEALATAHPLREQLWTLWAVALARTGRQADALGVVGRLRETLRDELGIDPGAAVQRLQQDLLRQDPTLGGTTPPPVAVVPPAGEAPGLVGRDDELAALRRLLADAATGAPASAVVTGEAGAGKSALVTELGRAARADGWTVGTVRCVAGDDAPPLWALRRTLGRLGGADPSADPVTALGGAPGGALGGAPGGAPGVQDVGDARYALVAALADEVRRLAAVRPLLLVVEDAHWCDPATLRVLQHVVDHLEDVPLAVVVTHRPEGAQAVAPLLGAVDRAAGTRLSLGGLEGDDLRRLVGRLTGRDPDPDRTAGIARRTGGNPLLVTELLRAGAEDSSGSPVRLPGLVRRRLEALPPGSTRVLRLAAVLGDDVDPTILRGAAVEDPDRTPGPGSEDVDVRLARAEDAGLLSRRTHTWGWRHALVRDAVLGDVPPHDLARLHALVAASLERSHEARYRAAAAAHWRAAGPAHAAHARRSTGAAADRARAVLAHEEEARLLRGAVEAHRLDPAPDDEAFDLFDRLARACRDADDWDGAAAAVVEAIAAAERLGRADLVASAATSLPEGSVWHVQRYGTVAVDLVRALHRSLGLVDPLDRTLRSRILLSIAVQSFYVAEPDELDALVDEALRIADDVGDDAATCVALQQAILARWRPATASWRLAAAERALALAERVGDVRHRIVCTTFRVMGLVETGEVVAARDAIPRALALAGRHGGAAAVVTLELLHAPLLLMAGRDHDADASLARVEQLRERVTLSNMLSAVSGVHLLRMLWRGEAETFLAALGRIQGHPEVPLEMLVGCALHRLGLHDPAEQLLASLPETRPDETYMGMIVAVMNAELALRGGDHERAARTHAWLLPYAGQMAAAGSTAALGPVDAFLALAAAACGRTAKATAHADAALERCRRWGLPRAAAWLRGLRDAHGF